MQEKIRLTQAVLTEYGSWSDQYIIGLRTPNIKPVVFQARKKKWHPILEIKNGDHSSEDSYESLK